MGEVQLLARMAKKFTLQATVRDPDKRASAVRQEEAMPAVLYGHGIDSQSLSIDIKEFIRVYREAGSTSLVMLTVGDKEHPVLIRETQLHPVKNTVLHTDFYQVRMDEKIRANVPLTFIGEAPAVKDRGGTLVRNMDEVDLSALPTDLPHDIEVDISSLDDFEKVFRVSDLQLPEGVELHHEGDDVIALVQAPKTQEEIDAELAEEITEDVEGVEGVADKEEGEEAEGETEESAEAEPAEGEEKSE